MAIQIVQSKCIGCGDCLKVCPLDAIKIENEKAIASYECVECGACIDKCPNEAISLPE